MKSEGEKPEGGASPEQEALNHPADTQEGLPSQASASSNAAPAEAKEENNQEPPTTAPAGEGQPPEAKAWESPRKSPRQGRVPAGTQDPGAEVRTTPCRDKGTGRARKPARGNRLFPRQAKGSHPGHRQPIAPPTLPGGTKNGKDGSNGGTSIGPEGGPPAGGGPPETGTRPRAEEGISREPLRSLPPWKKPRQTSTRGPGQQPRKVALSSLRASSRGRGNGLANQLPDRASYEVQGEVRYLTILARGGSRVVYTLDRERSPGTLGLFCCNGPDTDWLPGHQGGPARPLFPHTAYLPGH